MATASRVAVHTRKAMESVDERMDALVNEVAAVQAQLNRIEGALNDLLKQRVIENAAMPEVPTQKSRKKGAADDGPEKA